MEIKVNQNNYQQEIKKSGIVIVDFWASWCGPCSMLSPVLSEIANKYQDKVNVCKINVDEEPELAMQNNIMSIPTVFIYKDGILVNQFIGYKPQAEIEKMIIELD